MNKISYDKHIVMKSINTHKLGLHVKGSNSLDILKNYMYYLLSYEILKHWKFHFYIRSRNVVPCQMKQNTSDNLLQSVSK